MVRHFVGVVACLQKRQAQVTRLVIISSGEARVDDYRRQDRMKPNAGETSHGLNM